MNLKYLISALTAANLLIGPGLYSKEKVTLSEELFESRYPSFSKLAEQATPATVSIKAQITPQVQEYQDPFAPFRNDDFFRHFFGQRQELFQRPEPQPQVSGGSGFIVSSDGYIVTNHHVVKDASQITVLLTDGREFSATVKGSDARTDLAVLKIEEKNLPFLNFGDSDALKVGEWVAAIGAPFGLEATLTVGIVSAKGRQDLGTATAEDFIQTDAAINPGNSGGPLLNGKCEVIGVNSAILTRSGGCMGIGFAIPSAMARSVVDQIINDGAIKRAYLGVILQPLDQALLEAWDLEKTEGVLVAEITKNSAGEKGGIQQGDIILEYNGKPAKNPGKIRNEISLMEPGDTLKLKILRNKQIVNLSVALGQHEEEHVSTDLTLKLGLEVENLSQEIAGKLNIPAEAESGVVISKVKPGSPAHLARLKPSFLITGIAVNPNEPRRIKNMADFNAALKDLKDRKHIILIVRHQYYQQYYTLKLN